MPAEIVVSCFAGSPLNTSWGPQSFSCGVEQVCFVFDLVPLEPREGESFLISLNNAQ